jgi:hypothetical protein
MSPPALEAHEQGAVAQLGERLQAGCRRFDPVRLHHYLFRSRMSAALPHPPRGRRTIGDDLAVCGRGCWLGGVVGYYEEKRFAVRAVAIRLFCMTL